MSRKYQHTMERMPQIKERLAAGIWICLWPGRFGNAGPNTRTPILGENGMLSTEKLSTAVPICSTEISLPIGVNSI